MKASVKSVIYSLLTFGVTVISEAEYNVVSEELKSSPIVKHFVGNVKVEYLTYCNGTNVQLKAI